MDYILFVNPYMIHHFIQDYNNITSIKNFNSAHFSNVFFTLSQLFRCCCETEQQIITTFSALGEVVHSDKTERLLFNDQCATPAGFVEQADSPRELAEALGFDPDGFERTLERFNANAEKGEDPDFGRGQYLWARRLAGDPTYSNPNLARLLQHRHAEEHGGEVAQAIEAAKAECDELVEAEKRDRQRQLETQHAEGEVALQHEIADAHDSLRVDHAGASSPHSLDTRCAACQTRCFGVRGPRSSGAAA